MGTTLQEQLDWLDQARQADADLGFLGRMLALCSLPRTDQGKRSQFVRTNGPFSLAMSAGANGQAPLWEPAAPAPCLGMHRGRAHRPARAGAG